MIDIICTNCQRTYPEQDVPYRCLVCGGIYDFKSLPALDVKQIEPNLPGMWRYRHTFSLPTGAAVISLGEGNTPLIWDKVKGREVAFKLEYLNPSGSFKDRGAALLVSFLRSRGVKAAVEDSSGNAGAAFAAYAARGGMKARVFVPDYASGPKRGQIETYGADLTRILGPRSSASEAVRRAVDKGAIYASHTYLPHGIPGFATIAYELVDQIGEAPGTVILPVGQGSLILGIGRGFEALREAGLIPKIPKLTGVQARACAPLWALFSYGPAGLGWVGEGATVAEGIRIQHPVRGDAVFRMVESNDGMFVAVDEEAILPGQAELARRGFFVEPTSAVVWPALGRLIGDLPEPIAVILTGSGFKSVH
ncbi:MAG TPA: pyridoxal-phosphate dependent enzyme [Anaerolineales bacterium]|nr:pyridoxal-phosphate dependent enzyme [Anaerolineales bacterium]